MTAPTRGWTAATTIAGVLFLTNAAISQDLLVPRGSTWRYLDDGSDQGTAWYAPGFDDSTWAQGPAQLGYGDGDEATVVSYGGDPDNKYITTYFRMSFNVVDPSIYSNASIRVLNDDGAVVYLNGNEVVRRNLPAGAIDYLTTASSTIDGASEHYFSWNSQDPTQLLAGNNVLAVEIHQRSNTSSDISFDLEVVARDKELVTRGPYLQLATPTSIRVRWRTDVATDGVVEIVESLGDPPTVVTDPTVVKKHEVLVSGLTPDTRYYYSVGKAGQVLGGGDSDHSFVTPPPVGTRTPRRVWVLGDSGMANADAATVRDSYYAFAGSPTPDVWLMLGDNAYFDGTITDFQAAVFDMYPDSLRSTVLWPTRGNHETDLSVYRKLFSLPKAGEAGGVPSGTESYYSFDHANIHFVCLDSEGSNRAVGGAMWTWLEADLSATTQDWIIAFWHHPPYSKGSHDSDTETELVKMRENFLPLLEDWGVDLVLCGHSHSYERSFLLDGHYGDSTTFNASHQVDAGDGRPGGTGAYTKDDAPHAGAVYCVAGSSSKLSNGPLDHPAMYYSAMTLGSVVLDVNDDRMDVTFLDDAGLIDDSFTIQHTPWADLYNGLAGTYGIPPLSAQGTLQAGTPASMTLDNALENSQAFLFLGFLDLNVPFKGGVLVPSPDFIFRFPTGPTGTVNLATTFPPGVPSDFEYFLQFWVRDPAGPKGFSASNALRARTP